MLDADEESALNIFLIPEAVVAEEVHDEEGAGSVVLTEVIDDTESNTVDNMTLTPSPRGRSILKLQEMKPKTKPKKLYVPKQNNT